MSRSLIRIALVAFGLSALAPVYAFADDGDKKERTERHGEKHAKGEKAKHFPMTASKFKEKVEARLTKAKERMTAKMKKKDVPAEKQREAISAFDAGATKVRAAANTAGADGTVSLAEAKGVRELAKQMRKEARAKAFMGKPAK